MIRLIKGIGKRINFRTTFVKQVAIMKSITVASLLMAAVRGAMATGVSV